MCVYIQEHISQHTCGGQRATSRSQCSLPSAWILGIELKVPLSIEESFLPSEPLLNALQISQPINCVPLKVIRSRIEVVVEKDQENETDNQEIKSLSLISFNCGFQWGCGKQEVL